MGLQDNIQQPKAVAVSVEEHDSVPQLEQLSSQICSNAIKLSWYIKSSGLPTPSFGRETPVKILPSDAPDTVHQLRNKLKQDSLKLFRLASGPEEYVSHIAVNVSHQGCVLKPCMGRRIHSPNTL